jgi:ubiquitin C-terminal hydrolase
VLVLCFKRFDASNALRGRVSPVKVKLALRMPVPVPACTCTNKLYKLSSMVCHAGAWGGGHYFACTRRSTPDRSSWHLHDDTSCVELRDGLEGIPGESIYMAVYELVKQA